MEFSKLVMETVEINERLVRTVRWRAGRREVKMISDKPGYKTAGTREVKMRAPEKRKRRLGSIRAVRKKRPIQSQINRKRLRTLKIRGDR